VQRGLPAGTSADGNPASRLQEPMSSIKRNVKKKAPPRPEPRFFLEIQPTRSFAPLEKFGFVAHSGKFPLLMVAMASSWRERQAKLVLQRQPWFYPRLVAYGYFWLSEGA